MSTHAIDSELMNRIEIVLDGVIDIYSSPGTLKCPELVKKIKKIKEDLDCNRDWVVISVLHPGRLVPLADDPLVPLAWENLSEIADRVSNNQQYDDELDLAIQEAWEEILEENGKGKP